MRTSYKCDGCGRVEAAGRYGTVPSGWRPVPIFTSRFGSNRVAYKGLKRYCAECKQEKPRAETK